MYFPTKLHTVNYIASRATCSQRKERRKIARPLRNINSEAEIFTRRNPCLNKIINDVIFVII